MKIFIKTQKFISVITALCLLISFVIGPTAANAMTNEEATAKYKQIFKDFMLPYNYGQITSSHYAGTDRVIINIQDLHCHPKVQRNISNIIEIFDRSFGVKNVYLEGAYGQVSTKWITGRIDNIKKGEILEKMLETGRLTGAEYYSAISGKTEIISGLEEKLPYLENLKRFGEIIENQGKINVILKAMDESLAKVKQQYYTKRQYKLEELSQNYRDGTISPQKYYALLSKHIEKLGIDLSKYENTFTYITLLEMQKNLDYSKITNELQNLILLLRENLANSAYQMLVDNTENFSKIDKLYGYIVRISRELGLDLTVNFPNLDNYFSYIEFSQKINPLELIDEEKRLTEEINTRFSETKAQREVVFLTNFERYIRDYVSSKITADDYEYYKKNIAAFRQLWNKYVDNKVLSLLDEYIAEADKFYKINTDRNLYFTNNMFKESDILNKIENEKDAKGDVNKIIDNMKGVKEVDVVITGGFHSQTVTEILKNHGVSYIVITPNVTDGTKLAEETYYEIAKEQSKISFQALATLPFSAYPEDLRMKAAVVAFGKDIAKEIFPNRAAEIDSMDLRKFTAEEKAIALQLKKLRKTIEESKFLESDDQSLEDFIEKISGEKVDKELLEYVNLEDLKRILTGEEAGSIKKILEEAAKRRDLTENGTTMQQAIESFKDIFKGIEDRFTSQEEYSERQNLINLIRTLPKLSEPHKKLLLSRDDKHKRILEELSKYDYDRLEKYGQEDLQHYLELTKQLWNIKEITSPDQVRKEIEESFAKVEMFFTLIGYSAPQGNYEEITMSVLAPLMEKISKELGKERFGILSSPTASQGSIDAASTVLSQMYDALMVYITAKSYLGYVEPEKFPNAKNFKEIEDFLVNMDKADLMKNGTNLREFLNAFKFVAENGDIYSKAVAQTKNVPNFAIIIGGRAVSIENDLINAYEEGNEIFLINSRLLAAQSPAITEKRAINNSVEYFLFLLDLIDKGVIRFVKKNNEGEIEDEDKALMDKGIVEFITDDIVFDADKVTSLSPEGQELYKLLRSNELSPKIKKLIGILFEKGVKNKDDLGKLKIHVMDLDDADIDTTAGEKKVKEQLKEKGQTLAEKIFEIIKNFIKPARTADDLKWVGSVKSAEVDVQAFDLEYAKSHGYLEGVEEAEAKYDEDGYRYYVLKSEYDKGRHVTARIYDADPDNSTLSAKTNVSVNPMFVISEKGSVSFMGREKFERIYRPQVSKGKTVGQIFNATKKEVIVTVSFGELKDEEESKKAEGSMIIIDTDEGRDTVLPYYIVVKGIGKPYAMSIEEFMRIYPQDKNPEFYKQYESEIKRLQDAQNIRSAEKAETTEEQISQEQSDQQKASVKQKAQKKKKVNIRNIILSLLTSVVIFFSALHIGSALSERTYTDTTLPGIETVDTNQQTGQENMEEHKTFTPELSYDYFEGNSTDYGPKTEDDFNNSIEFSQQDDIQKKVKEAFKILGIDEESGINVVFMFNTNVTGETACAFGDINTVIIPITESTIPNITTDYIVTKLAHEITHLVHYEDVENGRMSAMLDETMATENGIVWDNEHERNIAFNTRYNNGIREINQVGAMELVAFYSVLDHSGQILEEFRNLGVANPQVYYAGVFWGENDLNDPTIPVHPDLSPTEVAIKLIDQDTGASLLFVVDTHININTEKADETSLKKDKKGNVFVEANTKDFRFIDESIDQQQQDMEEQGETTKDGKRTRTKPANKTTKTSKEKAQQTEVYSDKMTRKELLEILEGKISMKSIIEKGDLVGAFVNVADDLNVSRETFRNILLPLAERLSQKRIADVSTEENYLTFKILLSEYFQKNKIKLETSTEITDYEDAMKMGRLLYYVIGDKAADLTEQQIEQILPSLMDIYYKSVKMLELRSSISAKTGFYCLLGEEKECTNKGWESIFNLLDIDPQRTYFKCKGSSSKDKDIVQQWLNSIRNYPENKAEFGLDNMYAIYSGHGQPTYLLTGVYDLKVEDIVEALVDAKRKDVNLDLSEITLDLATCWSYFSSINIIEQLKKRLEEENLPLSFPNIVTDAGFESLKGKFVDMKENTSSYSEITASDLVGGSLNVTLSNKEVALIEYILKNKEKLKNKGLSLADFHNAERASANYTVFAVTNEDMESLFESLRQDVFDVLGISSDEITYGTKEFAITESDIYEEHFWDVIVQKWLAKKGNMIYMELLLDRTKKFLDRLGETGIIRRIYKDKAGENFKNTRLGKAIGVNLETFAFWMPNFVLAHNPQTPLQKKVATAVVWRIRALSIGIGFGIVPAIISLINPITAAVIIPAIITTLTSANILHYFYDIRKSKATAVFKKDEGNIYIIIDKGEAGRYSLTFSTRDNSIYINSTNDENGNNSYTKNTSQEMIENIEYFLHLKINISRNSITVKSTDSKADIQIVKQAKIDDMVSKLKGSAIVEEDEARKALKREFNIKDENIETVFLDEKEDIIREKVEKLMSEGEDEEKLLVIYPFSQIYNTKDIRQLFSLFYQLRRNVKEILGLKWFPSFKGDNTVQTNATKILLEFVTNAIFHGNLADLSKPIYIRYGKGMNDDNKDKYGFTVYNVPSQKTGEENLNLAVATMAGLSGAHIGLKDVKGIVDTGFASMEQNENMEIDGMRFYSVGIFQNKQDNRTGELNILAELNLENKDKYYDADKDKLEQHFLVNVGNNTYIFTLNIGYNSDIYFTLDYMNGEIVDMAEMDKVRDYLGIDFKVSDDNKTLYIIKTNNFNENTQIYPLDDKWDIPFQDMDESVSVEFSENTDFSDGEKKAIERDTGTVGSTDIYLDDYIDNPSELQAKIKRASDNNEFIIIHFFRNNNSQNNLTFKQILSKYNQIQKLVWLFSFYGSDSKFIIAEILKNAFVHGNQCKFGEPIAFYIKVNSDGSKINKLSVYNRKSGQKENIQLKTLAVAASLSGFHMGVKRMTENEDYDYVAGDVSLGGKNFYKASAEFHISEEEQVQTQQQESVEVGESVVTEDKTQTIVFNKKTLRDLVNSIKDKIRGFSKQQLSISENITEAEIFDVLEQALSEIEQNPMLVAMQGESANDVKFNVCEFKSLQTFIENEDNEDNKALAEAINKFLLSAILYSRDNKNGRDTFFTISDYRAIRNYIHSGISREESEKRLEQIRVIARLYGYISFKNEFFKDDNNKDKTLTRNSVIRIGEQNITLSQWMHICDGHSVALNGNEIGGFASSPGKYLGEDPERAYASAITMNRLADVPGIKENPDIVILQDSKNVYIRKQENSENFDVVVESIFGDLVTMYTVDGAVIKNDDGEYVISQFVENFATQRGSIDIFVRPRDFGYSYPEECCFKKDAGGNIFQFKNNSWIRCPVDSNGFVMLSRNVVSFDGKPEINKVIDAKVILCKPTRSSPNRYFDPKKDGVDTNWYKAENSQFVDLDIEDKRALKNDMRLSSFNIDGKDYYFLDSVKRLYFDSNLNLVDGYDILEYFHEINDYMVFEQIATNRNGGYMTDKDGDLVIRILIFDKSTKEWHYKALNSARKIKDGSKIYYIISKPIGILIEMDGPKVKNIQERLNEFKQIESGQETIYTKIAGKWYSFPKESQMNERIIPIEGAIDFMLGEQNYLYANQVLYEMKDDDTLIKVNKPIQSFDVDGQKYVNFDNKLYILENGILVPITEEQANVLKFDNRYGALFTLLLDVVNPTGLAMSLALKMFDVGKQMEGKNIIIEEGTIADKEELEKLREEAKKQGINIVVLKIVEEESNERGGQLIDDQRKIRMHFSSNNNELTVYSKQGISLNVEAIKKLIEIACKEGRKDLRLDSEQVIAFAERGDISSNKEELLVNFQDRITNAAIDGIQRADVDVSLDLSANEDINSGDEFITKCKESTNHGQSSTTIIIKADQLDKYGSEISGLRADGFRFILRGTFDEIRTAFEGNVRLDGAILEKAKKKNLEQLENIAADNVDGTLHIETQMYINMATAAKGINENQIYDDNGIIPIVTSRQAETMTGKYAIGYSEMEKSNIGTMLSSGKVVNILCSDKNGESLETLRAKLAGIFSNTFGTINELLKPRSPEQRISEETDTISDYDFGVKFGEEIGNTIEGLLSDLREGGKIKSILTTEFTEEIDAKTVVNNFVEDENSIYQQLPSVIKMRIQTEISKGNYFEAIGTIRGFVNQVIDRAILDQWINKDLSLDKQHKKYDEMRNEYLGKKHKDYRQYARITVLQLLMSNEELKLDSLVKLRPDTNQSVVELFEQIKTDLNKGVVKSIIENRTAIKGITSNDEGNTITNLGNILALLEDSLVKASATEQLEIPMMAVKNILAAA